MYLYVNVKILFPSCLFTLQYITVCCASSQQNLKFRLYNIMTSVSSVNSLTPLNILFWSAQS